jgi:acyl carrier protein
MHQTEEQYLIKTKEILQRLLSHDSLRDDDNIYEAGVTSIMVLPLLSEIEDTFGVTIPDNDFLSADTPRALAQLLKRLEGNE